LSRPGLSLVGISFLSLFLELAMIRFVNSTVQVIAYFNNFLILSAFLGLGLGALFVARGKDLLRAFPFVFAASIALMVWLDGYGFSGLGDQQGLFVVHTAATKDVPLFLVVPLVFAANLAFFVPLGYRLGQCLEAFENRLQAYGYDLFGSLLGVLGFGLCSYFRTTPTLWFGVAVLVLLGLLWLDGRAALRTGAGLLGIVALLGGVYLSDLPRAGLWSPYYKVTKLPLHAPPATPGGAPADVGFAILVDRMRIQDALRFGDDLMRSSLGAWWSYYQLPYRLRTPDRVLILGGGSGNDATVALQMGARHVDVVEIDPVIVGLGFTQHPHRPYADPRVRAINDDARAFVRRATDRYDLIVMNALDSHHQIPGLSTLRLESFIYTADAFADARRLLADDGLFVVHLSSERHWMGSRLYWSLAQAFGREPALFDTPKSPFESIAFVEGPDSVVGEAALPPPGVARLSPDAMRAERPHTLLATDDWPHLYLQGRTLPLVYVVVLGVVLLVSFGAFRSAGPFEIRRHLELFLLGAGFMLLETRSLTSMALSFGSTWIVSAVVIGSILLVVFAGNLLVLRGVRVAPGLGYALIAALLVLQYLMPLRYVAQGGFSLRLLLALLWVGAPVLVASLLFSRAFENVASTSRAFGANLLGVVVGGVVEYASMIVGLRALSLLAALLYLAAGAAGRNAARAPS
jgi:SAM-dependent methyltransferase